MQAGDSKATGIGTWVFNLLSACCHVLVPGVYKQSSPAASPASGYYLRFHSPAPRMTSPMDSYKQNKIIWIHLDSFGRYLMASNGYRP